MDLAIAQLKQQSNLPAGLRRLESAIDRKHPQRSEPYFEMAEASVKDAAKLLDVSRRPFRTATPTSRPKWHPGSAPTPRSFYRPNFAQHQHRSMTPKLPVGAYVPPFVKITAKDIENWVDGNVGARSLLPVLLRKLGNSRGQDLTLVDFPGYDQAEKKG